MTNINGEIDKYVDLINEFVGTYPATDDALSDISSLTMINESILDEEITKNPARFAWLASLSSAAKEQELMAENAYKKKERLLLLDYSSGTLPMPNGAKSTIPNVEAAAKTHPDREELYKKFTEAKKKADMLYAIVKALDKKGELIRTHSSNRRGEYDSMFTVKNNSALQQAYNKSQGTQNEGGVSK